MNESQIIYLSHLKRFAERYLSYCKSNGINIKETVERAQKEYNIHLAHNSLYNWKYGNCKQVNFYTLIALSNVLNKDIVYFLTDHSKDEVK